MDQTLAIIKPDAASRALTGKIVSRIESNGLKIIAMKLIHMSKDQAEDFYIEHKEHPYSFERFMDKLYDCGVAKITIVEELDNSAWTQEEIVDLAQDTVTLINNEVDALEEVKDKDRMKRLIKDLYMESLSL